MVLLRFALPLGLGVLASACGRLRFEERAESDAPAVPADAAGTCDEAAPFGAPVLISELSDPTADDGTMRVTPDELGAYFWSRRSGISQIYYAMRPDLTSPWSVMPVTGLDDGRSDVDPAMSSDGAVLVFRKNSPGDDLYLATASGPTAFSAPVAIGTLNVGAADTQPFLQPFGNELIFNSLRTGNGDLYRSIRTGTTFSAPQLIAELAGPDDEGDPVLTEDGLSLYFRSNPGGGTNYDIYLATRTSTASAFGARTLVPSVNAVEEDGPGSLSADGCRLYMTSRRLGTYDLYLATRGT